MNKNKVRTDNKKSQLYYELSFAALILYMFGINVANTQKVTNLYVVAAIMLIALVAYAILYTIFINRFKNDLLLEDNYVAYYVSGYIHSRRLKITTAIIDFIALLGTISFGLYYFIKMDFINVYPEYLVIFVGLIALIQLFILIKDISKTKSIDRIDAITNKHTFSIIDKKITFAIVSLIVCALNIGMLSYKTHNFIKYLLAYDYDVRKKSLDTIKSYVVEILIKHTGVSVDDICYMLSVNKLDLYNLIKLKTPSIENSDGNIITLDEILEMLRYEEKISKEYGVKSNLLREVKYEEIPN